MAFLIREHLKNNFRKLFGMTEEDFGDIADAVTDDTAKDAENTDSDQTAEPADSQDSKNDTQQPEKDLQVDGNEDTPPEDNDIAGAAPETPESEQVPGTGDSVQTEVADDSGKVSTMFRDIGKPETDYGLTNPNNIRLAKFRFKKAGIQIENMMNDIEKKAGLSAEKLIYRLTPEQLESYKEKGKELRRKFDLIEKREKNIIMFNARIPIYYMDKNKNSLQKIDESNPNLLKNAFSKIDELMIKRFGENWTDDLNAIDFLQGIKVNFAEKESISPNMITSKFFEGEGEKLIPFNKLYVRIPKSVEDFVKENKDNQKYLRSSIYRAIASGYLEGSTDSNGVFAILKGDQVENDVTGEENTDDSMNNVEDNTDAEAEEAMADINLGDVTDSDGDVEAGTAEPQEEPV